MIEMKIKLKEVENFEDDDIEVVTIETTVQSKGIKSTICERKVHDKIAEFIQSI